MKIGVLGGGQLGRMLGLAGIPTGSTFRFYDPSPDAPASEVGELVCGDFCDQQKLVDFCSGLDVVTFEFENIPLQAARCVAANSLIFPSARSLEHTQDRFAEKRLFHSLGIRTARVQEIAWTTEEALSRSLAAAIERAGYPLVLKTRTLGYDGRGQLIVRSQEDYLRALDFCRGRDVIAEDFVSFSRELSLVGVRSRDREVVFYPLVENCHREGILFRTTAPAENIPAALREEAQESVRRICEALDHVGVLTVEFFQHEGTLVANEIAPRVHNSGHWTIEGAATSQFENHVRALCGLPLGSTRPLARNVMFNLIGGIPERERVLSLPGTCLHLYGKEPRPRRKVGHITICESCCADAREFEHSVGAVERIIPPV